MNPAATSAYHRLNNRIQKLKEDQAKCEFSIMRVSADIYEELSHPATIIKRSVRELANDSDFRSDLVRAGVNAASHYLTAQLEKSAVSNLISKFLDKVSAKAKDTKFEGILNVITGLVTGSQKENN